jgi:hypothetical protein
MKKDRNRGLDHFSFCIFCNILQHFFQIKCGGDSLMHNICICVPYKFVVRGQHTYLIRVSAMTYYNSEV